MERSLSVANSPLQELMALKCVKEGFVLIKLSLEVSTFMKLRIQCALSCQMDRKAYSCGYNLVANGSKLNTYCIKTRR